MWGGYYEDGPLIWRSRWVAITGIVECREALAFPADPRTAVVHRRVIAVEGAAHVRVVLELRAGFGAHPMEEPAPRSGDLDRPLRGAAGALVRR